jgi:hypothetical protein
LLPRWPYVLLIFLLLLPMCFSSDLVTFVSYIYLVSLAEEEERTKLIPWKHSPLWCFFSTLHYILKWYEGQFGWSCSLLFCYLIYTYIISLIVTCVDEDLVSWCISDECLCPYQPLFWRPMFWLLDWLG